MNPIIRPPIPYLPTMGQPFPTDVVPGYRPAYLAQKPGETQLNKLRSFLIGGESPENFFLDNNFSLEELQEAFALADKEIFLVMHAKMAKLATMAQTPEYGTKINLNDLLNGREYNWGNCAVEAMGREQLLKGLQAARREVVHMKEELDRLRTHLWNNRMLIAGRDRTSFSFIPNPRKKPEDIQAS